VIPHTANDVGLLIPSNHVAEISSGTQQQLSQSTTAAKGRTSKEGSNLTSYAVVVPEEQVDIIDANDEPAPNPEEQFQPRSVPHDIERSASDSTSNWKSSLKGTLTTKYLTSHLLGGGIITSGVKKIHAVHDSFQPKLTDLIKAHLKGGANDHVCPLIRVYHEQCGRPCSTHLHCKDPHYACCKVICDDPWEKGHFKHGLYCHRMLEGKLPFDKKPEHSVGHGDNPLAELLFKYHNKKESHHDSHSGKKFYLIG